jgi:hypothetical protein
MLPRIPYAPLTKDEAEVADWLLSRCTPCINLDVWITAAAVQAYLNFLQACEIRQRLPRSPLT